MSIGTVRSVHVSSTDSLGSNLVLTLFFLINFLKNNKV